MNTPANANKPPETRFEVETRATAAVDAAIVSMHLHLMDAAVIRRIVGSAYPNFVGQMHDERSNGAPAATVRTACEIVLTNMLYEIVVSLAPTKKREGVLRDIVKKVRSSILTALGTGLHGASAEAVANEATAELSEAGDLAVKLNQTIVANYPEGQIDLHDLLSACAAIAGAYLAALPHHVRDEELATFITSIHTTIAESKS